MNERIKELSEQADNMADDCLQMPGEFHPDWHDVRDKFFVELIVKECIIKAEQEEDRYTELGDSGLAYAMQNFQYLLKQDFGVE